MPIISCPDCGHHPVSDRTPTCPKGGSPIAAANAPVASLNPSAETTLQTRTIHEERLERLRELAGAFLIESSEFVNTSVNILNFTGSNEYFD